MEDNITNFKTAHPEITIRLSLPVIARKKEEEIICELARKLIYNGFTNWEVNNLWGMNVLLQYNNLNLTGGTTLYTLNSLSIHQQLKAGLKRTTLSVEDETGKYSNLAEPK